MQPLSRTFTFTFTRGWSVLLPTGGEAEIFFGFFDIKMVGFRAFWWYYFAYVYIWNQ